MANLLKEKWRAGEPGILALVNNWTEREKLSILGATMTPPTTHGCFVSLDWIKHFSEDVTRAWCSTRTMEAGSFSHLHHFPPAREKQLHFRKDQILLSSNFTADNVILRCLPGQLNSSVILKPICYWQQCSTYWMQIYHLLLAHTWFFSPLGVLTRRNSLWSSPPLWDPPNANKPVA